MSTVLVTLAVEGALDEAVLRSIVRAAGASVLAAYGKQGKAELRKKVNSYNHAACFAPWVMLVDLDHEANCAAELRQIWLPQAVVGMCFRVAARAVETWILADAERFAEMVAVSRDIVPRAPEQLDDRKRELLRLVSRSRRRSIREDLLPRPGSFIGVGPAYNARLIEFVSTHWRLEHARRSSDSLDRCIRAVETLVRR